MTIPFLDFLYDSTDADRQLFGESYVATLTTFQWGQWVHVATFPKDGGDGQTVQIDEMRMPARFYRVRILPDTDSSGNPKPGFTLATGSGEDVCRLAVAFAKQVALGMIGLEERP